MGSRVDDISANVMFVRHTPVKKMIKI